MATTTFVINVQDLPAQQLSFVRRLTLGYMTGFEDVWTGFEGCQHSSLSNRLAQPNRFGSSSRRASAVADQVGTQRHAD